MSKEFVGLLVLLSAGLVAGCGSDAKSDSPPIDIEFDAGSNAATTDGGAEDDAGTVEDDGGSGTEELPPGCLAEGFEIATASATRTTSSLSFSARTAESADGFTDDLFFVHRTDNPQTGTLPLGGNFADCTNCLVVQTDCNDESCLSTYMAVTGSIELLEVTGTVRARLTDLTFEPVAIDSAGETTVLDGDAYCIDSLEVTAPVETDPCSDWPEPSLADINCGEAPLTVTFNASGFQSQADEFSYISIDFGDGETYYSTTETITSHTYQAGEWDAQIEAVGYFGASPVTLTTPEKILAY